ncbi:PPE domain-containing protein [Kitasatospora sp. NPDC001664]
MNQHTNFNDYSHADLRRMVGSMDSGGVMSAADPWRRATDTLKQIQQSLATSAGDATTSWEGDTSDAFHAKMTRLAESINTAAAYANDAAITLEMMSSAIDEAKRTMPEEPSFWSKAADAIGDTASSAVGNEDEDTKTAISDEKKTQAVAVMNLLATRYRAATSYMKPPIVRSPIEDIVDVPSPGDSMGSAAISALLLGGGMGARAGKEYGSSSTTGVRSSGGPVGGAPKSPKVITPGPTDPGIKGGTANPAPKPASPVITSPGTGLDGTGVINRPGTGGPGGPVAGGHGGGTGGLSGGAAGGQGGITVGGSASNGGIRATAGGSGIGARGTFSGDGGRGLGGARGGAFGAGGMSGGAAGGSVGGGAVGGGSRQVGRSGGVVGGAAPGQGSKGAFTEGGSGLGRARGQSAQGAGGQGGFPGANQAAKKKEKQEGKRPDYLVEDEETWATGRPANPNVVD